MSNITHIASALALTLSVPSAVSSPAAPGTTFELGAILRPPSPPESSAKSIDWSAPTSEAVAKADASPVTAPIPQRPALELRGLSATQTEIVTRSTALFERAGLRLPPLVVRAGADKAACGGNLAVHGWNEGWSEIVLCTTVGPGWERNAVLHELAHAWVAFELTDERRDAFQAIRGWEHWRNYELAAWQDNGTEQAAEIIAWGVYDRAAPVFIDHLGCDELFNGYRALTGTDTLEGHTALCDNRVASEAF